MWLDLIIEYSPASRFGLFIFQSLFMKTMMGGTYWENVRKTFMPEFISMNFMMAGMAPVMSFLMMGRDMRAMEPTELLFWGVMSLGVIVGFAVAYPFNVWLVARGLKHGLMTEREPGKAAHVQPRMAKLAHAQARRTAEPRHGATTRQTRAVIGDENPMRPLPQIAALAGRVGARADRRHGRAGELAQHDIVGARCRRR